jgi:rRNA-processing protein FCF1
MILFLELDDQIIINTNFLLYCFEDMSRLEINYQMSEVFVMGSDEVEDARIA